MALRRLLDTARMVRLGLGLARMDPNGDRTVADVIEEVSRRRAGHPFVIYGDRRLTYAGYNAAANRLAHWAIESGLPPRSTVALLMHNRPEYLETWAGLAKAGITAALINTNLTQRGLVHAVEAAGTKTLIVGSECLSNLATADVPDDWDVWVLEDSDPAEEAVAPPSGARSLDDAIAGQSAENPDRSVRRDVKTSDDLFYIYTSGTTGLPKAARFSHLKFMTTGTGGRIAGCNADDVMYCALPLYHSAGGAMAAGAVLLSGATLAVRRRFSAREFWNDVRRYDATTFQYIGEFCRYLLNQPEDELDGVHNVRYCIGNGLRPDIWERFQERFALPRIIEFYGATEGNVAMMNMDNKVGSVGRIPSRLLMDARIVRYDVPADEHVRGDDGLCIECGPGEAGELLGKLPTKANDNKGRFEGYTSKEATEKKILRDVFSKGDAWFRTGDLLKRDAGGYFYFVDRIGDTFRWKGENVSTQEVAEALGAYPGVLMNNVYGVEVPGADGRAGMVSLVLENPDSFDGKALYDYVADALPAYAAPLFVRLQEEPEVTGTLKLRKVELQKEGYDPDAVKEPIWFRDDAARAYVPWTTELHQKLQAGELRV